MNLKEITIRDPFILRNDEDRSYYLYGTCDGWRGLGFYCYVSKDLVDFKGPFKVFDPDKDFWGTKDYWAPEVYHIGDRYYMLASFKSDDRPRASQMLIASSPLGPFSPYGEILTPEDYESLDATLCFKDDGHPYIIYSHEWLQTQIGEICERDIADDFSKPIGESRLLFKGNEAPWACSKLHFSEEPAVITDGPFIYRRGSNKVLLWSTYVGWNDYGIGYAIQKNGKWEQSEESLPVVDGGHGMVFTSFEGADYLILHVNNKHSGHERAKLFEIGFDDNGGLFIK